MPTLAQNIPRSILQSIYSSLVSSALMCPMLNAPQNGTISCESGQATGSLCSFSCDTGFTQIGSSRRICRPTTIWSGTPTFCRPLQCVPLEPPENGVILAPCHRDYTSSCSILCTFGYTIDGPMVQTCELGHQTGTVQWTEPPLCIGELPPLLGIYTLCLQQYASWTRCT